MPVFINSSRKIPRDYTDELQSSHLHLIKVTESVDQKTFTLKWTVKNLFKLMKGVNYASHYIRFGGTIHRLRLLRHTTKHASEIHDRRRMHLLLGLTPPLGEVARVSFSILGTDDVEIKEEQNPIKMASQLPNRKCYAQFLESPAYMMTLTVLCKIRVEDPEAGEIEIEKMNSIATDFQRLLASEEYSDLTIEVDGQEFHVHRAILSARSPVFRAMFHSEMREKFECRLVIQDSDKRSFHELIQYMYTGKTSPLTAELALSLLPLADKYNMRDLQMEVEDFLYLNTQTENVLPVLFMADAHSVGPLKRRAIDIIGRNLEEAMNSQEWVRLRHRADLMEDILKYFI